MMTRISKLKFKEFIGNFQFRALFNALGWDFIREFLPVEVDNSIFELESVADKNGFRILVCTNNKEGNIPSYNIRLKIDKVVGRLYKEHLIIFVDKQKTRQTWQLLWNSPGKVAKLHSTDWYMRQDPSILYQKTSGLIFTLAEEEDITIVDVRQRVADNFHQNNEKVTKSFYERFKKEHTSFLTFIKGINAISDKDWYASLMLNRLMFCYFIQKKGFLNDEVHYLRERLKQCKNKKGNGKFYSFYRSFLLVLFHRGLNEPEQNASIQAEIGKVPYLNGGLFDEHELERSYTAIDIDDKAFERIFDFFDEYNWHLDTRMSATGRDINPDVIGYIFEKYINDRSQMGAYYTKEDITDYISKNAIIPWLFDETARHHPEAFVQNGEIWTGLRESGDDYIYEAVKFGIDIPLPPEIKVGLNDVNKRKEWSKPIFTEVALPTETWREIIERRKLYAEITEKITAGGITHINDFITYNLLIRTFAQDTIQQSNDPQLVAEFYKALTKVTILDPTCGSGAFLFAAMKVLEPLYDATLTRMEVFIAESGRGKHKFFEEILAGLNTPEHPNRQYFIYKSIILNNLYGVDIMREAVEIAKLRLFLKLVATVEADYRKPNLGLEPLPDIDFNIRSGNTLVGFAIETQIETGSLDYQNDKKKVKHEMEQVGIAYRKFKQLQLQGKQKYPGFKSAKFFLQSSLEVLTKKLDQAYFNAYGNQSKFDEWIRVNLPFHWFAEFYEIVHEKKGFDIIIGNPPYLEQRQIRYEAKHLKTFPTNAVHNMCIERSFQIISQAGNVSMIVPLALVCTQRMVIIQKLLEEKRSVWYSNFAWRPGRLFENVNRALSIFIANSSEVKSINSTKYIKWQSDIRDYVFPLLNYISYNRKRSSFWVPKFGSNIEPQILEKVLKTNHSISKILTSVSSHRVYYRTTGGLYWKVFTNFPPKFYVEGMKGKSSRETYFSTTSQDYSLLAVALLSSDLFWWWYTVTSNLRDLNPSDIQGFKFPSSILEDSTLIRLGKAYIEDISNKSVMLTRVQKQTGETQTQSFRISTSKNIIEEIDFALSKHYDLTEEELDYIVNYDCKFRMSTVDDEEEGGITKIPESQTNVPISLGKQTKLESMKEFTVHEGIYFVSDVVDYTGLPADKVRLWFKELMKEDYEGMSGKEQTNVDRLRISFHGLVEFVVIAALRELGFKAKKIFKARADLGAKTGKIYPFATNDVARLRPILHHTIPAKSELTFDFSSGNVSLNGLGQYNLEFVREFFSHIEFTNGYATKIFGNIDSQLIVIDPLQMSGKACINRKNVEAQVIAMQYDGEPSIVGIQAQYDVTKQEILEAVEYWNNN